MQGDGLTTAIDWGMSWQVSGSLQHSRAELYTAGEGAETRARGWECLTVMQFGMLSVSMPVGCACIMNHY